MDIEDMVARLSAMRAKHRAAVRDGLLEQAQLEGERIQRIEQEMERNRLLLRLGKDAPPDRLLRLLLNEDAPQKDAPQKDAPQRQRKPSETTLIKRARKAGERGPVRVTLPDGRILTSEREGIDDAAANPWDKALKKHATH
jgi:hypothetical protein